MEEHGFHGNKIHIWNATLLRHYIEKARINDPYAFTANRVCKTISDLNNAVWRKNCSSIMTDILIAKFTQNPTLATELKYTGRKLLAETDRHTIMQQVY